MITRDYSNIKQITKKQEFELKCLAKFWDTNIVGGYPFLFEKSNKTEAVNGRTLFCYLLRHVHFLTFHQIGEVMRKDHSQMVYYNRRHANLFEFDQQYRRLVAPIINSYKEALGTPLYMLSFLMEDYSRAKKALADYIPIFNETVSNQLLNSQTNNLLKTLSNYEIPRPERLHLI